MKIIKCFCLVALLFPAAIQASDPQNITTWNYYEVPPFTLSPGIGFAHDFVRMLNKEAKNRFIFKLRTIPRVRLNMELKREKQGVVLFVNWVWMEENARKKYLWTPALLYDRNEIISAADNRIYYETPDSLTGLTFGAVRGRKYKGLEELFTSGRIHRYNIDKESQALRMLIIHRIDVTTQPRSLALVLSRNMGIQDKIFFSPTPLFSFTRHLMVTPELKEVHVFLLQLVSNLNQNPEWKRLLHTYQLNGGI